MDLFSSFPLFQPFPPAMAASFDKSEMLREQVISKIYWGAQEAEVIQWLEEKGIVGTEADDLLAKAWETRRKAIRTRALMTLMLSIVGMMVSAGYVISQVMGPLIVIGYGSFLLIALGVISLFWFFKSLYRLAAGKSIGSVD